MKNYHAMCAAAEAVISSLLVLSNKRKATKFIGPHLVVKATRQRKTRKNASHHTFLLTVGQPNYLERKFIKQSLAAGEKFPVKKVQTRDFPVKREKARKRRRA